VSRIIRLDTQLSQAFYRPGETVRLTVHIESQVDGPVPARLSAALTHRADVIAQVQKDITLSGGQTSIELTWDPPLASPRGYGVDLRLESEAGDLLAATATAFDVLDRWTQAPRYGFLTDFSPGRSDAAETMEALTRYHVNSLQFYDWMYRHEQFLTGQEPYRDPLGRELSRATVDALIAAAHERGIAAMPYTAIYGASVAFYREHPDWALRGPDGKPIFFGDDFLVIMDPRPGSAWAHHLLDQFGQILRRTAFDGIHLDQYGEPKAGYDAAGVQFPLDAALATFIEETRACVDSLRPEGAVVFNAVNNWPIESVAPAAQDLVYIEVWPPHTGFGDLHRLIVEGQARGGGKPVVLAAYIDPAFEHNVRLADAVIFASGGGHIELGERHRMLADAYFPRCGTMSPSLAEVMRRYYDFAVRYQELIGPATRAGSLESIDFRSLEDFGSLNVWPIVREDEDFTAISLINLTGIEPAEWGRRLESPPKVLGPARLQFTTDRKVSRIWLASPDADDPSAQPLEQWCPTSRPHPLTPSPGALGEGAKGVRGRDGQWAVEIPLLEYWDLVVIEWADSL